VPIFRLLLGGSLGLSSLGRHDAERRGVGDAFYIPAAPNERLDLLVERRDWR